MKFILILMAALSLFSVSAHAAVNVSPTGAATYSIPIEVPPGINGMQPNLSLNYNSQAGNGLLGMGWGLSGLSTISRCPKTVAQDGVKEGIKLDASDRFCLDGQRLIAVAGSYGAVASEYRTEIESFSRITASSVLAGTGPASFIVNTKDGKTLEYGVTSDSRIEAQGQITVLNWALNKISDRSGNEITFSYFEDTANGHYHIERIDYAKNLNVAPPVSSKAAVVFVYNTQVNTLPDPSPDYTYENRSDIKVGYVAGSKYSSPVRISNIITYATFNSQEDKVRDYSFLYESGASTGRSRLLSLIESDLNGTPKPLISLAWKDGVDKFNSTPIKWSGAEGGPSEPYNMKTYGTAAQYTGLIDMNGDGLPDRYGHYNYSTHQYGSWVWINNGAGFNTTPVKWTGAEGANDSFMMASRNANRQYTGLIDMNGDGLPDRWGHYNSLTHQYGPWVWLNNGTGFEPTPIKWSGAEGATEPYNMTTSGASGQYTGLIDMNGDGLPDRYGHYNSLTHQYGPWVWINNGAGFNTTPVKWTGAEGANDSFMMASQNTNRQYTGLIDMNGDGLPDRWGHYNPSAHQYGPWVWVNSAKSDLLMSLTDRLGATSSVTYTSLSDSSVYTKGTNAVYPKVDYQGATYVVSQILSDDGIGGNRQVDYHYNGMVIDVSGRGNLGFEWMESTQVQAGYQDIVTTTTFNQTFPYVGRVLTSEQKVGAKVVSSVFNTVDGSATGVSAWADLYNGASNIYSPYLPTSTKNSYALNAGNTLLSSSTTTRGFGAATFSPATPPAQYTETVSTSTTGGFVRTAVNTYKNSVSATDWFIAQLWTAKVTKTIPAASAGGATTATRSSDFEYDPLTGYLTKEIIEKGNANKLLTLTTGYQYDGFGNRTATTVTGHTHDSAGKIVQQIRTSTVSYQDATGVYTYDGRFPVSTKNDLGHKETYAWDARFGFRTELVGPNQQGTLFKTTWTPDGFGRIASETRADGTKTTYQYGDTPGNLFKQVFQKDKLSNTINEVKTSFDALGRTTLARTKSFDGNWAYVKTTYDALGRVTAQSKPYTTLATAEWVTYDSYDDIGRPLQISAPGEATTTYVYNGLTTTENKISPTGTQSTVSTKNVLGQLASVKDANNGMVKYFYDAFGNLGRTETSGSDFTTSSISIDYDIRGNKTGMTDPDMGNWNYIYNSFGELVEQTDGMRPTAQKTMMAYDTLGRMTNRYGYNTNNLLVDSGSWTFDAGLAAKGKLSSTSSLGGSKSYIYDALGRMDTITTYVSGDITPYSVSNTYDLNTGRLSTVSYPESQMILNYAYQNGYLHTITRQGDTNPLWKQTALSADGETSAQLFGNGLQTDQTTTTSAAGRTMSIITTGTQVQGYNYTFDTLGNMTARNGTAFTYDSLNRLKNGTQYSYDGSGRIMVKDARTYTFTDPAHHNAVSTVRSNAGAPAYNYDYDYDANGNMLNRYPVVNSVRGAADRSFNWTVFNKVKSIFTTNGYSSYGYDANHQRLSKNIAGIIDTTYIGKLYEKVTQGTAVVRKSYIYAGGQLVSIQQQINAATKTLNYVHRDHLGSVIALTDDTPAQTIVEQRGYSAFGEESGFSNVVTNRGYTGHEQSGDLLDGEYGLINMNARLYDPELGMFISADVTIDAPTNMQSYNRYHYVLNNPFRYTDPSGNGFWSKNRNKVLGVVGMAVGTVMAAVGAYYGNEFLFSAGVSLVGASNQYYHGNNQPDVAPVTVVSGSTDATGGGSGNTTIGTPIGTVNYSPGNGGLSYTGVTGGSSGGFSPQIGLATGNMPDGSLVTDSLFVLGDQSIQSTMAPWEIAGGAYGAARGILNLSNVAVRHLYRNQLKGINSRIDSNLPLREQGLQSYKMRNDAKIKARSLMLDRATANSLPPAKTLKEMVRKEYSKGNVGDDMWRGIAGSSKRSNKNIDSILGIN